MLAAGLECPVREAAWQLIRRSVSHALDYDLRVLEPGMSSPYARSLDEEVMRTAALILGKPRNQWTSRAEALLWMPTRMGGMQLGRSCDMVSVAPVAVAAQCGARTAEMVAEIAHLQVSEVRQFMSSQATEQALTRLRVRATSETPTTTHTRTMDPQGPQ